jgi:hypothetical protein
VLVIVIEDVSNAYNFIIFPTMSVIGSQIIACLMILLSIDAYPVLVDSILIYPLTFALELLATASLIAMMVDA